MSHQPHPYIRVHNTFLELHEPQHCNCRSRTYSPTTTRSESFTPQGSMATGFYTRESRADLQCGVPTISINTISVSTKTSARSTSYPLNEDSEPSTPTSSTITGYNTLASGVDSECSTPVSTLTTTLCPTSSDACSPPTQIKPCRYHKQPQGCRLGTLCKFSHECSAERRSNPEVRFCRRHEVTCSQLKQLKQLQIGLMIYAMKPYRTSSSDESRTPNLRAIQFGALNVFSGRRLDVHGVLIDLWDKDILPFLKSCAAPAGSQISLHCPFLDCPGQLSSDAIPMWRNHVHGQLTFGMLQTLAVNLICDGKDEIRGVHSALDDCVRLNQYLRTATHIRNSALQAISEELFCNLGENGANFLSAPFAELLSRKLWCP